MMYSIVNDLNSPSRRITGGEELSPVVSSLHRGAKLSPSPRLNLVALLNIQRQVMGRAVS